MSEVNILTFKMNVFHKNIGWIDDVIISYVKKCSYLQLELISVDYSMGPARIKESPNCLAHPDEVINDILALEMLNAFGK